MKPRENEEGAALGTSGKLPDANAERTARQLSLAHLQEPASQASGFKPRVMFRLNISGTGAAVGNAASEILCRREPEPPLPAAHSPRADAAAETGTPVEPSPPQLSSQPAAEPAATADEPRGVAGPGSSAPAEDAAARAHHSLDRRSRSRSPAPLPPELPDAHCPAPASPARLQADHAEGQTDVSQPVCAIPPVALAVRNDDSGAVVSVDTAARVPAATPADASPPADSAMPPAAPVAAPATAAAPAAAAAPAPAARSRKSRWDMRADPPLSADAPVTLDDAGKPPARQSDPAAADTSRATSSAAASGPPSVDGGQHHDYITGRTWDAERDARRERDADRGRDRDREREKEHERERDRDRDRDRERDRDRLRDRERGRQPVGEVVHRGDGYSDAERKRGRPPLERDVPRRNREKLPRLEGERHRARSPEHAAEGAERRGGSHSRGVRGSSAGANGGSHTAPATPADATRSVVRTPAACAPVRTTKPVGLIIEEEPVTPPSAAGLFTVPAARPVVVREESVTPLAVSQPAKRPATTRAESPATPPPHAKASLVDKVEVKAEPPRPNGAVREVAPATTVRSPGQGADGAAAEPTQRPPPAAAARSSYPPATKSEDGRGPFPPEVHGSPVTPPEALAAEVVAARQPFGRPALAEPPEPPPVPPPVAPPPVPKSPPGSEKPRLRAAPAPPETAQRPANPAASHSHPHDGVQPLLPMDLAGCPGALCGGSVTGLRG